jgi:hypothetical protein
MLNIYALVEDLSMSQKSFYLIKEFNKCIENTDLSVGVFHVRAAIPPIKPLFGCRTIALLASYQGVIISTTLEEAEMCLKSSGKHKRILYLWDLDWLENPVHYSTAMDILRDDKLKIIARSKSHAEVIENFCNKTPIGIVDNWNIEQLLEVVQ